MTEECLLAVGRQQPIPVSARCSLVAVTGIREIGTLCRCNTGSKFLL